MLVADYRTHGTKVLFAPPQVTPQFRVRVASWAINHHASNSQVAAELGYIGSYQWKEIYRNQGPNGLLYISKGRKAKMNHNPKISAKKPPKTKKLTLEQKRLKQLEAENLELHIKNEALKLLTSMKQPTKKLPK